MQEAQIYEVEKSSAALVDPRFRFRALDGYRFLAAFCVVMYHYNNRFGLNLSDWLPMIGNFNLMVDFFFLLSGFVIARAYGHRLADWPEYLRFLRARFARLYPLHFVTTWLAVLAGSFYAAHGFSGQHPEVAWSRLPATLLLLHATGILNELPFNLASWSISAEFLMYALSPLFLRLIRRVGSGTTLGLAVLFAIAMTDVRNLAQMRPWTDATFDFGAVRAIPTFLAGMAMAFALPRLRSLPTPPWWAVHAMFGGVLVGMNWQWPGFLLLLMLAALIPMCALAELGGRRNFMQSKTMGHLGDASYGLYMVHQLVAIFLPGFLGDWGQTSARPEPGLELACIFISIGLALASYRWFETPMRIWISGVRKPRRY